MTRKKAMEILSQFEDAVKDKSWIGSMHPGDHATVIENYREAKEVILLALLGKSK